MDQSPQLPPDVALLWGRRPVARRGRRPSLTVEDITRAAVSVADAEGLGAVSMARVAAELGNSTMALYRHVNSKDELLLLMSDAALELPPEQPPAGDWRAQLTGWAFSVLGMMRKHPWYRQIPLNGPPVGPCSLRWLDRALAALADTGLAEIDKLSVVMGVLPIVHGQARLSGDLGAGYEADPDAFGAGYNAALAQLVDPTLFPALARAMAAGVFDPALPNAGLEPQSTFDALDAEFRFSLACYFDGVAAFMARQAPDAGADAATGG
jgi:AcrR family transcriptional regulator